VRVVGARGALLAAIFAAVSSLTITPAIAARGHVFSHSFATLGVGNGQLTEPEGLAVNEATGNIYVVDKGNNRVEYFSPTGAYLGQFNGEESTTGKFEVPTGIAIDNSCHLQKLTGSACSNFDPSNEDVYVIDSESGHPEHKVVDKFSANGQFLNTLARSPGTQNAPNYVLGGVAVDPRGELWILDGNTFQYFVDNFNNEIVNKLGETRSVAAAGGFENDGLAVDANDDLFVRTPGARELFYVAEVSRNGAPHNSGELLNENIEGQSTYNTIPPYGIALGTSGGSTQIYIDDTSSLASYSTEGKLAKLLERLPVPGEHGSGVAVNSSAQTVYVADSAAGVIDVYPPEPPGAPSIEAGSESIFDVTSDSATVEAEVNPRSEPGEKATSYRFEYGPCVSLSTCATSPYVSSAPLPAGELAASYEVDTIGARLRGLLPDTVYHVRVSAENGLGVAPTGEERVFTTQTPGVFALPDGRLWELVSPSNKHGAGIGSSSGSIEASVAGDAFTFFANAPIEAEPPSNSGSVVQVFSTRAADGWESRNIAAPHETAPGASTGSEYPLFSNDLSRGLLEPAGAFVPSISSEASEQTPFIRTDFPPGDPSAQCSSSCYAPLVTDAAGIENVPPGTVFGAGRPKGEECLSGECGPQVLGANGDASDVVLTYGWAPLTEGAPDRSLYEWAGGQLRLVSVLPGGKAATSASEPALGYKNEVLRNAISTNGARVVWSEAGASGGRHLYLRDTEKKETVQLDEVQGGSGSGTVAPNFQAASAEGTRVFFTDEQQLTTGSHAADLYECEIVEGAAGLECKLSDLTETASEPADVEGLLPGASEDGSYVYFVARGVLTGTRTNERSETAVAGQPNLYVRHGGVTYLIAVLSGEDQADWGNPERLTARVSPDGHWLAFMSKRSLAGYDNRDAVSGKTDSEVFLYHVGAGESGGGRLACASCDPTGARPHGVEYREIEGIGPGSHIGQLSLWVAATLPTWTTDLYQSRYLSDSGRLFFDSTDVLVPQDVNAADDAYEYEPPGVGNCGVDSATFGSVSGGCVDLVSSGTSPAPSVFFDASESGGDVFFLTAGKLAPQDSDSAFDVYDASECGVACAPPVSAPLPACEGDACQSPVAAPEDPTPGSLTYQGPGNPAPVSFAPAKAAKAKVVPKTKRCRKGFVKKRGKCVRVKAKRARKAANKQRGKS
jgi:DNA-binding beta-propeller fold protein YncE